MLTPIRILLAAFVLLLGVPLGNFLAKLAKEELKSGQRWFKLVIALCILGGFWGLISQNDFLLFGMFFVAIVTSRSLRKK